MAPVKPKGSATRKARKTTAGPSKSSSKVTKRPPAKQVKTKPVSATLTKSKSKAKKPQYTESQLNLPAINSIVPASANAAQRSGKGAGKKKNKIYIDDQESMMTILAMVNAEKEGVIESKMIKERQLEEIREARRKEAEKRAGDRKGKFEEVKKDLKTKGKNKSKETENANGVGESTVKSKSEKPTRDGQKKRKSVSFA